MRVDDLIAILFVPSREANARWLVRAWLAVLFVIGLAAWAYVIGFGRVPLDFHDWSDINMPRLQFLQQALRAGEWPLHMSGRAALHDVTDRFLTLPDVITSPQTLLLLVLPLQQFVVIDVVLQYSIGFAGLYLLRRHFDWSLAAFTAAFTLFLFNGHIVAHYSVGHFTWAAYFVFPLIAWLLFRFLDGNASWRALGGFAAAMFYMVLTGGQHHFTWVLLLLGLLLPFAGRRWWWLVGAGLASGLLSAVRLLPPVLELESFRRAGLVSDVIGFPSTTHLLLSLVSLRRETPSFNEALPGNITFFDTAFYEFTAYIGAAGVLVVAIGLYRWLRDAVPRYPQLIVPVFAMVALSIGSTYRLVRATHIPLLESERYTSRLFSLPMLFLIVMAVTALDRLLRDAAVTWWQRVAALIALLLVAIDVMAGVRLWRAAVSAGTFGPAPFDPAIAGVVTRMDPSYVNVTLAGLAISLVTAVTLAWLAWREPAANRT